MGLFSGLPKLPPELMAMLANPAETGRKIKAFVKAAYDLTEAVDNLANEKEGYIDGDLWRANEEFKRQLATLPKLDV